MSDAPHVLRDGRYLALKDDTTTGRVIDPGEEVPAGWHLMTEAEFESHVDWIAARAIEDIVEEIASRN